MAEMLGVEGVIVELVEFEARLRYSYKNRLKVVFV